MSSMDSEQAQTAQPLSQFDNGDLRLEEDQGKPAKQNSGRKNRGRRGRNSVEQDGQILKELKKDETPSIVSSDVTAALAGLVLQGSANVDESKFDFVPPGAELQQKDTNNQELPSATEDSRPESQELPQTPHPSLASSLGDYLNSQELKINPATGSSQLAPPAEINEDILSVTAHLQQNSEFKNEEKENTNQKSFQNQDDNVIQEEKENVGVNNNAQVDVQKNKNFSEQSEKQENYQEKVDLEQEERGADVEEGFCNGDMPSFDQYAMNGNDSDLVDSSGDEEQVATGDIRDDQIDIHYKDDAQVKNNLSIDIVESDSMLLAQAAAEALKFYPSKETIKEGDEEYQGKPKTIPPLTMPALEFQGNNDVQETPRRGMWFSNFFGNRKEGTATTPSSPRDTPPPDQTPLASARSLDGRGGGISPQRSIDDMKADIARLQEEAVMFSTRKSPLPDDMMVPMSHQREPSLHLWSSADATLISDLSIKHEDQQGVIFPVEANQEDTGEQKQEEEKEEKELPVQDSANLDENDSIKENNQILEVSNNNKDENDQQEEAPTLENNQELQENIIEDTKIAAANKEDNKEDNIAVSTQDLTPQKETPVVKINNKFEQTTIDNKPKIKKDFSPVQKSSSLSTIVDKDNNNSKNKKVEKSMSENRIDETKVEVPESVSVKAFATKLQTQLSSSEKEGMLRTYVHSITRRKSYTRKESGSESFGKNLSTALGKTSSISSNSSVGPSFKSQASVVSHASNRYFENKSIDETSEATSQVSSENSRISKLRKGWESGAPKKDDSADDEQESKPNAPTAASKTNIRSIMENFKDQTKKPPQKEEKQGGVKGTLKMFQDAQPKPKQTKKTTVKMDSKFGQTLAQFQNAQK